jgi:hypothetical protein
VIVPLVTLLLLGGFLVSGYQAHWFDVLLTGQRTGVIEWVWEYRASVWGAALLGWALRNDISVLWSKGG